MILATSLSFNSMNSGIKSSITVPTGILILRGFAQAPPEIVSGRSMRGFPSLNASLTAHTVPTFIIIAPESNGSLPAGTSTPSTESTIFFSQPCGYLVFKSAIEIMFENPCLFISSVKSGIMYSLLFSIEIIPFAPATLHTIASPSITFAVFS